MINGGKPYNLDIHKGVDLMGVATIKAKLVQVNETVEFFATESYEKAYLDKCGKTSQIAGAPLWSTCLRLAFLKKSTVANFQHNRAL